MFMKGPYVAFKPQNKTMPCTVNITFTMLLSQQPLYISSPQLRWLFCWQVVCGEQITVCVMFLQEGVASHNENMQYLNLAVSASVQRERGLCHSKLTRDPGDTCPVKRDSRGQIRKNSNLVRDSVPFRVPFGPHLIPVHCQQEHSPEMRAVTTKDLEVSSDGAPGTELSSAVRLHLGKYDCSPGLTQCRPRDCADGTPEKPAHTTITTNDLLDCLVHPDIIARVTKLLLERHTGSHPTPS